MAHATSGFRSSQEVHVVTLDFVLSYWQLPVHPDSYDAWEIVTPNGVYASSRILEGLSNATAHFQRIIELLYCALRKNMKAWLDDFYLHGSGEVIHLEYLKEFFKTCEEYGLF